MKLYTWDAWDWVVKEREVVKETAKTWVVDRDYPNVFRKTSLNETVFLTGIDCIRAVVAGWDREVAASQSRLNNAIGCRDRANTLLAAAEKEQA